MKAAIAIAMTLAVGTLCGCERSPRGGSVVRENEGFRLVVPTFGTTIKQGELQTITVSLRRDGLFKQDVKLNIEAAKGISIKPASITVKASDRPDVQVQIAAPQDAALGEYPVVVTGTPEAGEPTSVGFTVNVVSP